MAMWARASLFRRFTDTNLYGTSSVKMWKTRHKISLDTRIFLQCSVAESRTCVDDLNMTVQLRNNLVRAQLTRDHVRYIQYTTDKPAHSIANRYMIVHLLQRYIDQGRRSHRIIGGHKRRLGVWGSQRGPGAEPQ